MKQGAPIPPSTTAVVGDRGTETIIPLRIIKPNRSKRRAQRLTAGQRRRRLVPFARITLARKRQRLLESKARKVRKSRRRDKKRNKAR